MTRLLVLGCLVLVVVLAGMLLTGCAAEDRAAAERAAAERAAAQAEADRELARAEAYQVRQAADTAAAAERSAIRSAESAATFERVSSMLPYFAMVLGAAAVAGFGLLLFWDLRARPRPQAPAIDPAVLLLLDQQRRQLAEAERSMWRLVASEQRRRLDVGERSVVIYDDHGDQVSR